MRSRGERSSAQPLSMCETPCSIATQQHISALGARLLALTSLLILTSISTPLKRPSSSPVHHQQRTFPKASSDIISSHSFSMLSPCIGAVFWKGFLWARRPASMREYACSAKYGTAASASSLIISHRYRWRVESFQQLLIRPLVG